MSDNYGFTDRFIEACGTAKPAEIQRLLNISYQAAKNYLSGRLPSTDMLLWISGQTRCSIDWLLTGHGKKFVGAPAAADTPLSTDQMEIFVRRICVEVIGEMSGRSQTTSVVLQPGDLLSEKVPDEDLVTTKSF